MIVKPSRPANIKLDDSHFRALMENSMDAVLLTSPDGKIQNANPAACQMFGRSNEEICELGRSSILEEADPRLQSGLQLRAQTGKFFGELTGIRKDGSKFQLEISSAVYLEKDGLSHTCTIMRDISERKQLERSLLFQSQIVENIAEGINLVRVSDGTIVYVNPSFNKLFGYEHEELIGRNISIVNAPSEKSPIETANEIMVILREKGCWIGEVKNIKKNGEVFWSSVSISSIDHYLYGPVWISLHTDITRAKETEIALKENETKLRDLNSTKDIFFSIIAHDLKSPFNAILGFSDLLMDQIKQKDYEGIEEFAGIIHHSAKRAMDLLENLLEWSRLQTGRMMFNPERIDLAAQIREIKDLFNDAAQQKGISFTLDLPENLYLVVDPPMLNSILRNIVSNAIKFTNQCGQIHIGVSQGPNEVLVLIKDNGVGIPKVLIQKLFRIDETFSTAGTNKEKGTGLGLILVKEFIEKHGGQLFVESTPGMGSTFSFTLPV